MGLSGLNNMDKEMSFSDFTKISNKIIDKDKHKHTCMCDITACITACFIMEEKMDRKIEITEKYQYLKSRKRLDLLKSNSGVMYNQIINGTINASDKALMFVREAYQIALEAELVELSVQKKIIEEKMEKAKERMEYEHN